MSVSAIYFDGETARDRQVTVTDDGINLTFSGIDTPYTSWGIKGLHAVDPPSPGQPYRLTHEDKPGARLIIRDAAFIKTLVSRSSHLKGGYSLRDFSHIFGWTVGGIAAVVALGYFAMTYLPDHVAQVLPDGWRNRIGGQMETAMIEGAKTCHSPAGDAALGAMIADIAEGVPELPAISVHVYDMPVLNAFAVPGGKIILTRELLAQADGPDEIAGVLAHEIGHVAHLHPEAQLVRLTGMQVLTSVFTGSNGGDMTSNIAFLATALQYTRAAEAEADAYARDAMVKSKIDTQGLKTFFEKILKLEGGPTPPSASSISKLGGMFSTHPGTEDRIKLITPLPAGVIAKPSLSNEQWLALKDICKG